MKNQILSEEFRRMQKLAGINENEIKENPVVKAAEVEKIKMLFNQPTLKTLLSQINTDKEYADVIDALHSHFPENFKKNMSVQAVSTRLKLDKETPPPTAP